MIIIFISIMVAVSLGSGVALLRKALIESSSSQAVAEAIYGTLGLMAAAWMLVMPLPPALL